MSKLRYVPWHATERSDVKKGSLIAISLSKHSSVAVVYRKGEMSECVAASPWFDGLWYVPAHVGWYQVRNNPMSRINWRHKCFLAGLGDEGDLRYWDGEKWLVGANEPFRFKSQFGSHASHQFRGFQREIKP